MFQRLISSVEETVGKRLHGVGVGGELPFFAALLMQKKKKSGHKR